MANSKESSAEYARSICWWSTVICLPRIFATIPIPLPPPAEQKRIVKRVEEVVSLVNKLKSLVAVEK